ncbi:MAG: type III pantothenate kinase [Chloroflexota bacterium]|jgi:type III pantothenate kinase
MLLCIDIGNTNIKLGMFDGGQMCCHWRIATDRNRLVDEYAVLLLNLLATSGLSAKDVHGVVFSSVVPTLTPLFEELSQTYLRQPALILTEGVDVGMRINTHNPAEVGSDLIMNALAARHLYGAPVIVIGFGTATTFSAVSAEGNFEGVAIAPGILTSAESLFRATATLPQVALAHPQAAIGKNTLQSMRSGIVFGFSSLVDGLVERIRQELGGNPKVVATGGLAELIAPQTRLIEAVEPNLALIGLRLLYERNRSA